MKASELIKQLQEDIEHGEDYDVAPCLWTENKFEWIFDIQMDQTPEVKAQFFELLPDVMLELSKAWIKEHFHIFAEEHFKTYYINLKKEREALYNKTLSQNQNISIKDIN